MSKMRLLSLSFLLLTGCGCELWSDDETPSPPLDRAALDATILERMEAGAIPGLAACIVKNAAVSWCNGYGKANLETGAEVTPDTPFILASLSKVFTATAVMQQRDQGTLALDAAVTGDLSFDLAHPNDATPIGYRMLLNHTARPRSTRFRGLGWYHADDTVGSRRDDI
jgi:CubicO group peptidase (beta-lactamase class C family)